VFCKIKKRNPFQLADCGVQGLILGQIIGRWGNFFNREVFGEYTNNLFAMRLPIEAINDPTDITANIQSHIPAGANYIQVHPTFLYEGVLNLILFIFMVWYHKRKKFNGEICLLYLGGYGIIRFFVEGIRTDQLKIGGTGIAVSQLLGISLFMISAIIEVLVRVKIHKKENAKNE
jgi:phosphatidylglycerol:prolipoprotein diacylglycerol transferase